MNRKILPARPDPDVSLPGEGTKACLVPTNNSPLSDRTPDRGDPTSECLLFKNLENKAEAHLGSFMTGPQSWFGWAKLSCKWGGRGSKGRGGDVVKVGDIG